VLLLPRWVWDHSRQPPDCDKDGARRPWLPNEMQGLSQCHCPAAGLVSGKSRLGSFPSQGLGKHSARAENNHPRTRRNLERPGYAGPQQQADSGDISRPASRNRAMAGFRRFQSREDASSPDHDASPGLQGKDGGGGKILWLHNIACNPPHWEAIWAMDELAKQR